MLHRLPEQVFKISDNLCNYLLKYLFIEYDYFLLQASQDIVSVNYMTVNNTFLSKNFEEKFKTQVFKKYDALMPKNSILQ